jgi:hypothetical protein
VEGGVEGEEEVRTEGVALPVRGEARVNMGGREAPGKEGSKKVDHAAETTSSAPPSPPLSLPPSLPPLGRTPRSRAAMAKIKTPLSSRVIAAHARLKVSSIGRSPRTTWAPTSTEACRAARNSWGRKEGGKEGGREGGNRGCQQRRPGRGGETEGGKDKREETEAGEEEGREDEKGKVRAPSPWRRGEGCGRRARGVGRTPTSPNWSRRSFPNCLTALTRQYWSKRGPRPPARRRERSRARACGEEVEEEGGEVAVLPTEASGPPSLPVLGVRAPKKAERRRLGKETSSRRVESFKVVSPLRLLHISSTTLQGCTSRMTRATAAALS